MAGALRSHVLLSAVSFFILHASPAPADEPTTKPTAFAQRLYDGELNEAMAEIAAQLKAGGDVDQASYEFAFGVFLRAFEQLAQDLHHYGFLNKNFAYSDQFFRIPRLDILKNDKPDELTYERAREIIKRWAGKLSEADALFEKVKSDKVAIPIAIGRIRLDLDGDGKATSDEAFWKIFTAISGQPIAMGDVEQFVIRFDRSDVEWFRGYCHLLLSVTDITLAYDWPEFFDYAAPVLFANVRAGGPTATKLPTEVQNRYFWPEVADTVGFVHLLRGKLIDARRLKSSLQHLEKCIDFSRSFWRLARAETDDEMEWIPNPDQHAALAGMTLTERDVILWHDFLSELEGILKGKILIPHWRWSGSYGVNVRRAFLEPRDLDVVLWGTGAAAAPYIERGILLDERLLPRLQSIFGGNFMWFAAWVN